MPTEARSAVLASQTALASLRPAPLTQHDLLHDGEGMCAIGVEQVADGQAAAANQAMAPDIGQQPLVGIDRWK